MESKAIRCKMKSFLSAPLLVGVFAFALYAASSPPGVGVWDTAEFQTVAWIAGISHPTGFPAAIIMGFLFTHLFSVGNPAWRLTIMSGIAGALASAILTASLRRFGVCTIVAVAGGILFAVGQAVWIHATRACVESVVLLFGALATALALAWSSSGERRALLLAWLFAGLSISAHMIAIWYVPGLAILTLSRRSAITRQACVRAFLAFFAGIGCYAYLPIRSATVAAWRRDPTASIGMPPGQAFWDYDHPATLAGFIRVVTGADYGAGSSLGAIFHYQQYPAFLQRLGDIVVSQNGIVGAVFAFVGLIVLFRRVPLTGVGVAAIAFFPIPFSMTYRMLDDAAKYYLVTVWIAAWCAALGAQALSERLPRNLAYVPAALLAVGAAYVLQAQAPARFAQRNDRSGEYITSSVLAHTESNAIIAGLWYYITPLAYAKYVEKTLGERIPVANTPREYMASWARTRPVYWFPEVGVSVPNAVLLPVPGTDPPLYRVTPIALPSPAVGAVISARTHIVPAKAK